MRATLKSSSTEIYLETLGEPFVHPADHAPPAPDLDRLRAAGIPTVSDEEFERALDEVAEHRRQLLGMIKMDAREWPSDER